jgi:hypothetical protein
MEVIRPDWESFDLYNSILGAHLFEKERGLARIYIPFSIMSNRCL